MLRSLNIRRKKLTKEHMERIFNKVLGIQYCKAMWWEQKTKFLAYFCKLNNKGLCCQSCPELLTCPHPCNWKIFPSSCQCSLSLLEEAFKRWKQKSDQDYISWEKTVDEVRAKYERD